MSPSPFDPAGPVARALADLGWPVTFAMIAIAVIVIGLLLVALVHGKGPPDSEPYDHRGRGVRWIVIGGVAVPAVILAVIYASTLATMRDLAEPRTEPAAIIRVTASQWWWKVEYRTSRGEVLLTTANEIHIPAGRPVRLELASTDVIHSFWVPRLAGKTDLVPGRLNSMWLQADEPGEHVGQCAEFCGESHANMRLRLFVDAPDAYGRWIGAERRPASAEVVGAPGFATFQTYGCAACHRIAGTLAQGRTGPDLTHVGRRVTLAAGILPNTPGAMAAFLRAPDSLKPGSRMPDLDLEPARVDELVAFLQGLR
jgi:cytochrome c oxidase subunit II